MQYLDAYMHNMGLCMNPTTMLNKFLIAIAFSEYIGDSPPDEAWYEDAWLNVCNNLKPFFFFFFFLRI